MVAAMLPAGAQAAVWNVDSGGAITDGGTSLFYFTVSDHLTISDVNVRFSSAHEYAADLKVSLTSPQGTTLLLFQDCGGSGANFQDTLLDDDAMASETLPVPRIGTDYNVAPFAGVYRLETNNLSAFDGQQAYGVWTLTVEDVAEEYAGTVLRAGDAAPWGTAVGTQLIIVPEPATVGVLAAAGLLLALRRRRA
jgi:subtilisin-like proprotein convertase family protein